MSKCRRPRPCWRSGEWRDTGEHAEPLCRATQTTVSCMYANVKGALSGTTHMMRWPRCKRPEFSNSSSMMKIEAEPVLPLVERFVNQRWSGITKFSAASSSAIGLRNSSLERCGRSQSTWSTWSGFNCRRSRGLAEGAGEGRRDHVPLEHGGILSQVEEALAKQIAPVGFLSPGAQRAVGVLQRAGIHAGFQLAGE
jgi:hypothetical protein